MAGGGDPQTGTTAKAPDWPWRAEEQLEETQVGGCLGVSFLPFVFSIQPTTFAFIGLISRSLDLA